MKHLFLVPWMAALLALAACGGAGTDLAEGGGSGGSLKVFVTDAPFPSTYVESATVVIREVRARNLDTDAWEVLFEGEASIDLVPLTGGVSALLVETVDVPPGSYDEVRLIVDAGEVVLSEDAHVEGADRVFSTENGGLQFPSGSQTGIKVKIDEPVVVTTELSADLTLDFDLAKNFVFNGPPDHAPGVKRVIFTPVVRAVNETSAGTVKLVVLSNEGTPDDTTDDLPAEGASVVVLDGEGTEVASVTPALDGTASVSLAPGFYDVVVEALGHESETYPDVEVVLGNVTNLGTVRLLVSLGTLAGTVTGDAGTAGDASDDVPLEGATVAVRPAGDATATPVELTTDASGFWQLENVLPGAYDLTLSASGHASQTAEGVVVEANGSTTVDVTLAQAAP